MRNATAAARPARAARRSGGRVAAFRRALGGGFRSGRLPAFIVALGALALLYGFLLSGDFTVARVTVHGAQLGDAASIVTTAEAIGDPIFTIDASLAAERVAALPYVERVSVSTRFPDEVVIRVTERVPAAIWQVAGRDFLVDARGHVLAEATLPGLPVVTLEGEPPVVGGAVPVERVVAAVAVRDALDVRLATLEWTLVDGLVARLRDERVVIFGDAGRMPAKLAVLAEVERVGEGNWTLLDLREPDRPYYK